MFCRNCGKECSDNAALCPACGEPFKQGTSPDEVSKTTAALFAFFLGWLGIHDFILGKTARGIGKIALWLSGCVIAVPLFPLLIWNTVDLFHIAAGTYPSTGKKFTGNDDTAKALATTYLVLAIFAILVLIAAIALLGFTFFSISPAQD